MSKASTSLKLLVFSNVLVGSSVVFLAIPSFAWPLYISWVTVGVLLTFIGLVLAVVQGIKANQEQGIETNRQIECKDEQKKAQKWRGDIKTLGFSLVIIFVVIVLEWHRQKSEGG